MSKNRIIAVKDFIIILWYKKMGRVSKKLERNVFEYMILPRE